MNSVAIAIVIVAGILFLVWQQRRQVSSNGRGHLRSASPRPQRHLERKLFKLLGGNTNTANRLIQQSRLKHPDKSPDWHWEKVIYDLERDRWR